MSQIIQSKYMYCPPPPPKPKRPPHGLIPWKLWNEQRKEDIEDAIIRYTLDEKPIPKEWVAELQTLTAILKEK